MIMFVCLDDNNGMLFNHRRQSRDQAVFKDMLALAGEEKIYMNAYSAKVFALFADRIVVQENFLEKIPRGSYGFLENSPLKSHEDRLEAVVVYYWNRVYPADTYLDVDLSQGWEVTDIKEFGGTSHENITRKTYRPKIC